MKSPRKPPPGCPCAGDDGLEEAEPLETLTRPSVCRRRRFGRCGALGNPHQTVPAQETTVWKTMPSSATSPAGCWQAFGDSLLFSLSTTDCRCPGKKGGFIQTINSRACGVRETTVSSKPSTPGPGRRRFHPNHQLPGLGDDGPKHHLLSWPK